MPPSGRAGSHPGKAEVCRATFDFLSNYPNRFQYRPSITTMGEQPTELLQGTLDMLILNTLALTPLHGVGIARRIEQVTRGAFLVKPGSLFPALYRMEAAGWV